MKSVFSKIGRDGILFFGGILIGLLMETFGTLPLALFVPMSKLAHRIVTVILVTLLTAAWIFFAARTLGYKNRNREFDPAHIVFAAVAVFAMQQAISPLFRYVPYVVGAARTFAYALFLGGREAFADPVTFRIEGVPLWGYHVCMLLLDVFYLAAMLAGEYCGVKKRQRDRDALVERTDAGK